MVVVHINASSERVAQGLCGNCSFCAWIVF